MTAPTALTGACTRVPFASHQIGVVSPICTSEGTSVDSERIDPSGALHCTVAIPVASVVLSPPALLDCTVSITLASS